MKIKIKSGTNDYAGERNPHAKFGNSEITGSSPCPHMGHMISGLITRTLGPCSTAVRVSVLD